MPEKSPLTVSQGYGGAASEKVHVRLVAPQLSTHPRPLRVCPSYPRPTKMKSATKSLKDSNSEATQMLGATDSLPVDQGVPSRSLLLIDQAKH